MKQIIWLLVSFLMFVPRVKASITVNTDVLKKSVVFIYAVTPEGEADVHKPLGSGFLVGIPGKADPSRGTAILVTARHIVDPEWTHCSGVHPNLVYARVNKKKYDPTKDATGVGYLPITLMHNEQKQYFVSDDDMWRPSDNRRTAGVSHPLKKGSGACWTATVFSREGERFSFRAIIHAPLS